MKEFFGFGGYQRVPEGYLSWQHLTFVTTVMIIMTALAVILGFKNKRADEAKKNRVLVVAAILIDVFEIFKIVMMTIITQEADKWLYELPLFLCSIQLITIPLAAFSKGRIREAALDFVFIFGLLGAVLGTYGAGQNYACYPVLSFDNVVSAITHSISGFSAIYIGITGLFSMKKKNIFITFSILMGFCVAALSANLILDYNYMFLMRPDGTPYELIYSLVGGNAVLYPIMVVLLFIVYIMMFYATVFFINKHKSAKA